ncbi:MAG: adenosylcobinamide-phosphate synthase CbiB [Oscillospiraceae bacterium]|nr:adenosylcobinamide-phosphate synthase CbiB [Oscillospiraceae bacterium]
MKYLIAALPLLIGFLLDLLIGDPYDFPHPIRWIGRMISALERIIRKKCRNLRSGGIRLTLIVLLVSSVIPFCFLCFCYWLHPIFGIISESVLICYLLAARNLCDESMKVCRAMEEGDTEGARAAVSMIVGRDTKVLDGNGIIRAAVETVAENASDGVIAPLFYIAIGGASGGFFYKAANTMDSMIGYKNETYAEFGRFAAKLDDVLNYIPSRLSALLMIVVCPFLHLDMQGAFRIWKRDRRKHASPNSAQTESVCAGALNVRLAGDAWYFGMLHKKPYIGDPVREIESEDIRRANRLMYGASAVMLFISIVLRCLIIGVLQS